MTSFARVLLLTLGLAAAACGGRSEDAGSGTQPSSVGQTTAACGTVWTLLPPASCKWMVGFTGDPTKCVGVESGPASAARCRAVCGETDAGDTADTCVVGGLGDSTNWRADCEKTTGPDCSH